MKLDIRTSVSEPRRQTFGYLARRFGEDRPATRYEEAVLDIQAVENFHYRPSSDPSFELYDTKKTKIVLEDWHVLTDPRQFYYATYNISRAALEAGAAKTFELAEKQGWFSETSPEVRELVAIGMIPMRHYKWGANRINWSICDRGFGAPVTSAAAFTAMDHLGMAQLVTKLGLAFDDQTGTSLDAAKQAWLSDAAWQGVRKATEDMLVVDDWFEAFIAQNFAMEGIVHRVVFDELRARIRAQHGTAAVMTTEVVTEIHTDQQRWIDAVIRTAAAASPANRAQLARWVTVWTERAVASAQPLANRLFGNDEPVTRFANELHARAGKLELVEAVS